MDIKAPRAWYKPLGIMVPPDLIESIIYETKVVGVYLPMDGRGYNKLRMSDFEFMQPLGREDRFGYPIFEGDIQENETEVRIICYDTKQSRFKAVPVSLYKANAGNGGWTGYDVTDDEIIGNIYNNPEWLAPKEGADKHE